ncbi:RIPOR family member 3 isoform X2 [Tachysurus fulvidraco]|uniref:RIPOR family member 3 isoform X2 n=1 Tax=Tachysurus fulvidraco TaxID=1234273 RepID=UPI001FED865A|nr:RIPOR family member 3 isoform X2 [Tachysurus fulvidraco]
MSVKLRFDWPAKDGMVQRSCSFTGVNTLTNRHRLSYARTSLRTKGLTGKSTRILSSTQVVGSIWGQQPEQVDRVFQVLQKGLKEYLEGHKTELEFLLSQQRDSTRNSRLAFFYDLEKDIRALERYIRRLEFQISKVEGLYETYCIQWRLCQGAINMKRAFSLSPSSRESRESLLELNRNHRQILENMCSMEGELDILLGELQIKMKGLIGFARLCPGDQYEVLIRLGQQRWRIRGRIQTDDQQLWNEEQMVFLPHIHESFEIKVTEVKNLSSNLVGMVTCKCADFYSAHPQMMIVDITELATIKLQLEVVWNTPDILPKNGVVATNQELEPEKAKVATNNHTDKVEKGVEEKQKVLVMGVGNSQKRAVAMKVGLLQAQITTILQEMSFIKEIKHLNLQIQQLNKVLKRNIYILKTSSREALDVEEEEVLGSFDFLSFDFNTEDTNSCMSSSRLMDTRFKGNTLTSREVISELSTEQQHTGYMAKRTDSEDRCPLSTGEYSLDLTLEIHLSICIALLRELRGTNLEYMQLYILKEISHQTDVLKRIASFTQSKTPDISSTELWSGAPKLRNVMMLWDECCECPPAFCCTADSFLRILRKRFIHNVKAKLPGQADTVFARLLQQVQSPSVMVPLSAFTIDLVSIFQLHVYLKRWKVTNFAEHISQISREVYLVSCLETPKRRKVLKKLKGRMITELQPMGQTLHLLAKLLTDNSQKVAFSAASCLSRASVCKSFKLKAVVHYTWLLKDNDIQVQQQACLALKCLKAVESAEQVAELWHSTDEELRNAARETILSFGTKGHKAFQRMDQIRAELQEEVYKNLKTEITIF